MHLRNILIYSVGLISTCLGTSAFSQVSLEQVVQNVNVQSVSLAAIISDVSLVAGIGFLFAALFKFDQHKKNPTQVPIGQPLTLLLISAMLTCVPVVMPMLQAAIFGDGVSVGKIGSEGLVPIVSSS